MTKAEMLKIIKQFPEDTRICVSWSGIVHAATIECRTDLPTGKPRLVFCIDEEATNRRRALTDRQGMPKE